MSRITLQAVNAAQDTFNAIVNVLIQESTNENKNQLLKQKKAIGDHFGEMRKIVISSYCKIDENML